MTVRELLHTTRTALVNAVGYSEADAMAHIIVEDLLAYSPTQLLINSERTVTLSTINRANGIVKRVVAGEPLQYIFGTSRFRGRDFIVQPGVLIPRPETGQLVDLIVDRYGKHTDLSVLDLGSGSGCIAISLAKDLKFPQVTAVDIMPIAIDVTRKNSERHRTRINAVRVDIFKLRYSQLARNSYDIIVSNPPYILESEKSGMEARVWAHEPTEALFVDDEAPIEIYKAIAEFSASHLNKGGALYLEINPLCANQLKDMLKRHFCHVDLQLDYKGNLRFAIATDPR